MDTHNNGHPMPAHIGGPSLKPAVLCTTWILAGIAAFVVASRSYIRFKIIRRFAIDDWLILLGFSLSLTHSCFLTVSIHWGLGQHMENLQPLHIVTALKYAYLGFPFAILSAGIGRISFAFSLLAISPPKPWRRRVLWSIICVQFVVDCTTVILGLANCHPMEGSWNPPIGATCLIPNFAETFGAFQGAVASLVDLILAAFPASLFWNLQMEWKQKLSLSLLMGLGVFAMVASIVKTIWLQAIATQGTWAMGVLAICWTLESYLVLIAACVPTLRPIMKSAISGSRFRSSRKGSSNNSWQTSKSKSQHSIRGGFKSNDAPQLLGDGNDNRPGYKANIYALTPISGENLTGIQKDTTLTVADEERVISDVENNREGQPSSW